MLDFLEIAVFLNARRSDAHYCFHRMRSPMLRYVVLALGVFVLLSMASFAKWKKQYDKTLPDIQAWYSSQRNANGQLCCDKADGHPYFGKYRLTEDGGVELQWNGKPYWLPSYMVLKGPNPTGHAIWWYTDGAGGHLDYCFAPGGLS
jgi:hypothetical protein